MFGYPHLNRRRVARIREYVSGLHNFRELGVCELADTCHFFSAESVDPPIFSFKSETALFENFLWRFITPTVCNLFG